MGALRVAALLVASAVVVGTACGRDEPAKERGVEPLLRGAGAVGRTVPVGEPGSWVSGIAVGEGGVWVAGWGSRGGVVSRLDKGTGDVVATVPVPHDAGGDIAVGAGAVWSAGDACIGTHPDDPDVCLTEPRLSRIDPDDNRVAATIAIPLPPGTRPDTALTSAVTVGEGAVWVAVSWNPGAGEVVRVDPRTNAIAARIPAGGFVGEMRLAAGSLWVLSHSEYTDETRVRGASLIRIDPSTNAIVATPLREALPLLGGTEYPPVLAGGDDAVWVTSPTAAHPRLALRVDTHTNRVTSEHLRVERFYPVAVEDDAIWFIGSTGRSATLGRLDPQTLEQTDAIELPISAVRAAVDAGADNFWIASQAEKERAQVARVQIR